MQKNQIDVKFQTIRASLQKASAALDELLQDRRIVFGAGFPQQHSVETTTVLVNKQSSDDLKGFGQDASEQ